MDEQGAVAVAAAEVAVVDVDIAVAGVLQSVGDMASAWRMIRESQMLTR